MKGDGPARWWLAPPIAAGAILACGLGSLFADGEPAGADMMLHINDAWCFARSARALDAGLWCDGGSLGYPLALTYQPLPAMFIALVHVVFGATLLLAAKIAMALPLVFSPLAFAVGARLAGLDRARAAAFGVACGCVLDVVNYGLGPRALLNTGLLPQVWAHVLAPIAVGASLAFVVHARRGTIATVAIAAMGLCHPLVALEAAAVVAVVLVMPVLGQAHPRERRSQDAAMLRRALALCLRAFVAVSFFVVPLATIGDNNGGLVILPGSARTDLPLLLATGALLDDARGLPLLTLFVVVGGVLAAAPFLRFDRSRPFRALAIALVAVLAYSVIAADIAALPSPLRMTTRVAPLAQAIACWLAVEAAFDVAARLMSARGIRSDRAIAVLAPAVLAIAVLAIPAALAIHDLARNPFARRPALRGVFEAVLADVRALPPGNIVVRGNETRGWRHLFLTEAGHPLAFVTMGAPASASTLTFRMSMEDAINDPWRYGVVGVVEDLGAPGVDLAPELVDERAGARDMRGRWRVRAVDDAVVVSGLTRDDTDVSAVTDVVVEPSRIRAHVVTNVCEAGTWLLVRRSDHPWWTAYVDGARADVKRVPPSLIGVRVPLCASPAGCARDVVIEFTRPWWWWVLVFACPLALFASPLRRALRSIAAVRPRST